jgi:hypothetical protein
LAAAGLLCKDFSAAPCRETAVNVLKKVRAPFPRPRRSLGPRKCLSAARRRERAGQLTAGWNTPARALNPMRNMPIKRLGRNRVSNILLDFFKRRIYAHLSYFTGNFSVHFCRDRRAGVERNGFPKPDRQRAAWRGASRRPRVRRTASGACACPCLPGHFFPLSSKSMLFA